MKITIVGTGFVGVVTAAVYASFGHEVVGLDIDENKVSALKKSKVPFYEPNLEELLKKTQQQGNLTFTTDYKSAVTNSDIVMIAVGTPSTPQGNADLRFVFSAAESAAPYLKKQAVVVVKSTVPPGTLPEVAEKIAAKTDIDFATASVPEFLKEGSAVHDTLHPDRIVIGANKEYAYELLEELHKPLHAPIVKISPESAQMAKYAANAYLATRITFINQIADLCEKNGADVQEVIQAISEDSRVGGHYWYPGFGYGGSCFPKDVKELAHYSRTVGESGNLFNKLNQLNEERIPKLFEQYAQEIDGFSGKTVAILGLSFKPNTDDMREAPSTKIIPHLVAEGAKVRGYDPKALSVVENFIESDPAISYHNSIIEACEDADVIVVLIEWSEIVAFDYSSVRNETKEQVIIDARNQLNKRKIKQLGFRYIGVGR